MEKMIGLKDLLKHEVIDLYSAEEQIIGALPAMVDKATNNDLKKALQQHLKITEEQKRRLDKVQQFMRDKEEDMGSQESGGEKKGFFSRLFKGNDGREKCKGIEGLIDEGKKIMNEDMSPEALDAAIIACAQKIEHYEISGYGTARAYAGELKLEEVRRLLEETLNEEYEADDRLTELALKRVNLDAEKADTTEMEDKAGDRPAEQSKGDKAPAKKSESKEQTPPAEKKSSLDKTNTSNKKKSATQAKRAKRSSSKRKADKKPDGQKNKKNAPKRTQNKSKKAPAKSKSPAR